LESIVAEIAAEMASAPDRGTVAGYIPPLGEVDPARFGIAVVTPDGSCLVGGDADQAFSIQSISKVFTLTIALGRVGDRLWNRVGREPSGSAFNSIVQLESEHGIPRNPFVNAGAIVLSDVILAGHQPRDAIAEILSFVRSVAGDSNVLVDERVAQAEQQAGFRNAALANYLREFKNLDNPVDLVLGVYFHQCAIAMSCRQLALAGRYLMQRGINPATGSRVTSADTARGINALMLTCGHYDGSGDFAFRVGLPGKSGVGGGILAIMPGVASIAVWSPGLNPCGNSQLGTLALERLTKAMGWSVLERSAGRL
jgi:glutaminase